MKDKSPIYVKMDRFKLRWYQKEVWDSIFIDRIPHNLYVASRRCGKDILGWNAGIYQALARPCLVLYMLKTGSQAKKVIFNALTSGTDETGSDAHKLLDFIPPETIESINKVEMTIYLKNNSKIQLVGAENFHKALVGTNPYALIVSEFATLDSDEIIDYMSPIIACNGGWMLLLSTPRGKNHMYRLHKKVEKFPEWRVFEQPVTYTNHIPPDVLERERARMDPCMFAQEYMCSYDRGISGSYYQDCLDKLRDNGCIGSVSHDPSLLVYVAIDIGIADPTTLIWYQVIDEGRQIFIIDCYSNTNMGLDHYAKIIKDKPYNMGGYYAPSDIKVREWGSNGTTRYEKARQLGINFTLIDQLPLEEGIENVWALFPRFRIDAKNCKSLIDALENYRREWDERNQEYKSKPVHNWASHYADALRYLCLSINKTKIKRDGDEYTRIRNNALYAGKESHLPPVFRNINNNNFIR